MKTLNYNDFTIRDRISKKLARERLAYVNSISKNVKPRRTFYSVVIKRLFDIVISILALIITFPFNIVFAICTFIDVGHPIFFKQERIGKNGKSFQIVKFRNMTDEVDENGVLLPADKRVTRFGKFMRRTSMDELLNFWSIFKGDMSLIGPRPLIPEYTERYSKRHRARLSVKPGLECPLWHLDGDLVGWQKQFENDVWYVEHVSFLVDCKMVIKLVQYALDKKNSKLRSQGGRDYFIGYSKKGTAIAITELDDNFYENINS